MMQTSKNHYVYIWEFEVGPESEDRFLDFYGPHGVWAKLFAKADGYVGTLLLCDQARPTRYLTVDRWVSERAFQAFRAQFQVEYDELDRACEPFTTHEASLGSYRAAS